MYHLGNDRPQHDHLMMTR